MKNQIVTFLVLCVYALSLFASAFAVQPVQAALGGTALYMADMEIEKTSSAGGAVNSGDTITYTVTVNNTSGATQNNLVITDLLPAGTTYVPQSTSITYDGAPAVQTYRDEFNSASYSNSNGTINWSPKPWKETGGDTANSAIGGTTKIYGGTDGWLRFEGLSSSTTITRPVPMAGAVSATLSFDYRVVDGAVGPGDNFYVQVDGGSGFTSVDSYVGNLPQSGSYSRNISSFANANTTIRFAVQSFEGSEMLEIDNVQVEYNLPGPVITKDNNSDNAIPNLNSGLPPTMIKTEDNVDLAANGNLTLTYQVVVDDPLAAGITEIVNTAELMSADLSGSLVATVIDRVREVQLTALKTAASTSVPETGAPINFTFTVKNDGADPVTITDLLDDRFEDLSGDADCTVGTVLGVGASCSFVAVLNIPAGDAGGTHVNTFTVMASDAFGNTGVAADSETLLYTNVMPQISVVKTANPTSVPEIGGSVTYTFTVTNTSAEAVTITGLDDDRFGPLPGGVDCEVETVLAAGASCSFDAVRMLPAGKAGSTHNNVFTASAQDNDGSSASAKDNAVVTYSDVLPSITVTKTANPTSIPETGANVTFTFVVENTGQVTVTLDSLMDDAFGDLNGLGTCAVLRDITAGGTYTCTITKFLSADDLVDHSSTITALASDVDGNTATDSDGETVTFTDVLPEIRAENTASPTNVLETGGSVTFTYTVTNIGTESVTVYVLHDDRFGILKGDLDCQAGTVLPADKSCSFEEAFELSAANAGDTHTNIFTASASDNDGNSDTASDSETVTYVEVPAPTIEVLKEVFVNGSWVDANEAPGPQITYGTDPQFRFTVRNIGNVILTDITLSDSLYSTDSCAIPASLTPNDGTNGTGTDEFSCKITAPWVLGQHTNTAEVTASYGGSTVSDSDPAYYLGVNYAADLAVTKTDDVATYVPGQPLTYTITVTNSGPDRVVEAFFSDAIPAQISRWTWTCVHLGGATGCDGVTNSTTDFSDTIELGMGDSVTYTVIAETRASATTALTNTAVISTPTGTDDTDLSNNSATDTDTATPQVDLSIIKVADTPYRPNVNLSYTITVTNHGPSDATGVVVSDLLPNEVTFVSANPVNTGGSNPVTWNLGTLTPGDTRVIRLVVLVKDWVTLPFTNTATVSSITAETTVTDNSASAQSEPEALTPVELLYFRAKSTGSTEVLVEWEAETEVHLSGYKLFRTTASVFEDAVELTFVEPNAEMIYSYTDTGLESGSYYYWLVDVSSTSAETLHGPVQVIVGGTRLYLPVLWR